MDVPGVPAGVDVLVGVGVPTAVPVGLGVVVGVWVATEVPVGVGGTVGVWVSATVTAGVDIPAVLTINWGASAPDSREERLMAVEPGVESPKLYVPSPVTKAVTSSVTQLPLTTADDVATLLPIAGALLDVMVVSPQVLFATDLATRPLDEAEFAWTKRRPCVMACPASPDTLKRK